MLSCHPMTSSGKGGIISLKLYTSTSTSVVWPSTFEATEKWQESGPWGMISVSGSCAYLKVRRRVRALCLRWLIRAADSFEVLIAHLCHKSRILGLMFAQTNQSYKYGYESWPKSSLLSVKSWGRSTSLCFARESGIPILAMSSAHPRSSNFCLILQPCYVSNHFREVLWANEILTRPTCPLGTAVIVDPDQGSGPLPKFRKVLPAGTEYMKQKLGHSFRSSITCAIAWTTFVRSSTNNCRVWAVSRAAYWASTSLRSDFK